MIITHTRDTWIVNIPNIHWFVRLILCRWVFDWAALFVGGSEPCLAQLSSTSLSSSLNRFPCFYSLSSLRRSDGPTCPLPSLVLVHLVVFVPFSFQSRLLLNALLIDSFVGIISRIIPLRIMEEELHIRVLLTSANSWGSLDGFMDAKNYGQSRKRKKSISKNRRPMIKYLWVNCGYPLTHGFSTYGSGSNPGIYFGVENTPWWGRIRVITSAIAPSLESYVCSTHPLFFFPSPPEPSCLHLAISEPQFEYYPFIALISTIFWPSWE